MLLLGVKHSQQQREADCLVVCCTMILDYLQVPITYDRLADLIQVQAYGAFFSNVHQLEALHLAVSSGQNAEITVFEQYLEAGLPVLVAVNTWTLLHWEGVETQHALIVVGIDLAHETIYAHDPFFTQAPWELSLHQFEPAWTEMGRQYAVVGLAHFDPLR
jgi:ABC-type bacteriocin/lantibiotic exporter with double-glycine peptidase domain